MIKYVIIPFKIVLFIITICIMVAMDLFLVRLIGLNFKQDFLITKKDWNEMKDWTLKK